MSNSKLEATFGYGYDPNTELTICGDEWREFGHCAFSTSGGWHVCVRPPTHDGLHECSCGSVVLRD